MAAHFGRRVAVDKVENKVLWFNKAEGLPFHFQKGKPLDLAFFATAKPKKGADKLLSLPAHGRSLELGKVIFRANGMVFRDLDVKGAGHLSRSGIDPIWTPDHYKQYFYKANVFPSQLTRGIFTREDANLEIKNSQRLIKGGIRVALPIAKLELKEVINEGRRMSVKEAKRKGTLTENDRPVALIRAFGTRLRLDDLEEEYKHPNKMRRMIADAKSIVEKELGRKLTYKEYANWFAANLGEQVARLQKMGLEHGSMNSHNVTLDGKLVDFDEVKEKPPKMGEEFFEALAIVNGLSNAVYHSTVLHRYRAEQIREGFGVTPKDWNPHDAFYNQYFKTLGQKKL